VGLQVLVLGAALIAASGCGSEAERAGASALDDGARGLAVGGGALQNTGAPYRHLVIVSIDTLRRDRVGALVRRAAGSLTPTIDSLAVDGLLLRTHYSCASWTLPSMACILSGAYPTDIGFIPTDVSPLPASVDLLAESFQGAGFRTALISANDLLGPRTGLDDGYSSVRLFDRAARASVVMGAANPWLATVDPATEQLFLHVHVADPHMPYDPPGLAGVLAGLAPDPWGVGTDAGLDALRAAWAGLSPADRALAMSHIDARYNAEVSHVDASLQVLLDDLHAAGVLDDALVVVVSDHGEQLFDHGGVGHALTLHTEETSAVALFWSRDMVPTAWNNATSHIDLAPTILDAFGLPLPAAGRGVPIGHALPSRPVYSTLAAGGSATEQAAKVRQLRLFYRWTGDLMLFDHSVDPQELTVVADETSPAAVSLWSRSLDAESALLDPLVWDSPVAP
jgi:arylsulfatase A-like enzyme